MRCTRTGRSSRPWLLALTASALAVCGCSPTDAPSPEPAAAADAGDYGELLALRAEIAEFLGAPESADGAPDAVARRVAALRGFHRRLAEIGPRGWPISRQIDYLVVRGILDEALFVRVALRPWARDPGFYVDRLQRTTFVSLPVAGAAREALLARLAEIPAQLAAARGNLTDPAADYVALALHNLDAADGVGHGHPYRAEPPPGVRGWYQDLRDRASREQPELVGAIDAARRAIDEFQQWLLDNQGRWTSRAGVGRDRFDWYLRHVRYLPYDADQVVDLARLEFSRLTSSYALERLRNAGLPELRPAATAEEYAQRIRDADAHVRGFVREQGILTVPDFVGDLDTNVPWIERPGGRNFWEEIQYRDPRPDHVHAVIPGHRFDGLVARALEHPIRAGVQEGGRVEGWGYYLEEMFLDRGFLADLPRTRELFYVFGIKRAVRVPAEVYMHLNRYTIDQAVDHMVDRVPYLDRNVARVDAEIYLRRPPGYGSSYLIGGLEIRKLLADRYRQLGDDAFDLRAFHDDFLAAGRIPVSLIRWQMTGLDDEVRDFWAREALPGPD